MAKTDPSLAQAKYHTKTIVYQLCDLIWRVADIVIYCFNNDTMVIHCMQYKILPTQTSAKHATALESGQRNTKYI